MHKPIKLYALYRTLSTGSLIGLILLLFLPLSPTDKGFSVYAQSADDFESLMDEPTDLPPNPGTFSGGFNPEFMNQGSAPSKPVRTEKTAPKKKRGWHFGNKKKAKDNGPPPTEEQIVNVGPRKTAPSPDPLFRLPLPIRSEKSRLLPGFYLGHQRTISPTVRELTLIQKNIPMMTLTLNRVADTAPAEPVERLKGKNIPPPKPSLSLEVSEDRSRITFVLKEGDARYQSRPIPTDLDPRPELRQN